MEEQHVHEEEQAESSPFCLYCFSKSNLSDAHLFPKCIGGSFAMPYCCERCNSSLGTGVESKIKDCLFFCHAMASQGVTRDEAFRNIEIRERNAESPLKYVNNKLFGKARPPQEGKRIAPPRDMRRLIKKDIEKRLPHWVDYYMERYDAGEKVIRVSNETHRFYTESQTVEAEYRGRVAFPDELLAKIAYEAAFYFGQFKNATLKEFYSSTFDTRATESGKATIRVADDFHRRVWRVRPELLKSGVKYDELAYREYHRIDFRVSEYGVAYVRIEFYGILPFLVSLGRVSREECNMPEWLDKAFLFPLKNEGLKQENYPDNYGDQLFVDGSRAELMMSRYEQGGLSGFDWPIDGQTPTDS